MKIAALKVARPAGAAGASRARWVPGALPAPAVVSVGAGEAVVRNPRARSAAPLWTGPCGEGAPTFARTGNALLCALPGGPVLRLERAAKGGLAVSEETGADAPGALALVGGEPWAIWRQGSGEPVLVGPLPGGREKAVEGPAPQPTAREGGERLSACGTDPVLFESDARYGFRAHLRRGGDWHEIAANGAHRDGFNADVLDAAPWQDGVAVLTGLGADLRAALFDLPARGEVLHLRPDGRFDIIVGELRTSPQGLKVPRTPPRSPMMRAFGTLAHACEVGGGLAAALNLRGGGAIIGLARPGGGMEVLREMPGPVLDLWAAPDGGTLHVLHAPAPDEAA